MKTVIFIPYEIGGYHGTFLYAGNKSYLLAVIWNYVKKSYSCIVVTSEDP